MAEHPTFRQAGTTRFGGPSGQLGQAAQGFAQGAQGGSPSFLGTIPGNLFRGGQAGLGQLGARRGFQQQRAAEGRQQALAGQQSFISGGPTGNVHFPTFTPSSLGAQFGFGDPRFGAGAGFVNPNQGGGFPAAFSEAGNRFASGAANQARGLGQRDLALSQLQRPQFRGSFLSGGLGGAFNTLLGKNPDGSQRPLPIPGGSGGQPKPPPGSSSTGPSGPVSAPFDPPPAGAGEKALGGGGGAPGDSGPSIGAPSQLPFGGGGLQQILSQLGIPAGQNTSGLSPFGQLAGLFNPAFGQGGGFLGGSLLARGREELPNRTVGSLNLNPFKGPLTVPIPNEVFRDLTVGPRRPSFGERFGDLQ